MAQRPRPDRTTFVAFGAMVVLIGANLVAIRYSNRELAPFWGAGVRFALAALLFAGIVAARRLTLPRGPALAGAAAYGLIGFSAFFAFQYWGLARAPAGLGAIVIALVPLLTFFLAVAHGLERFRWRALVGGIVSLAGIAVAYGGLAGAGVPLLSLLALVAGAVCAAETGIVVKRLPPNDPIATNAVGAIIGATVLLLLSVISGEPRVVPAQAATWAALAYLVPIGTVVVFLLFLFILKRWQASAVAYEFVLAPFVAVALDAALAGEAVTPVFAAGGALVLVGVYIGALASAAAAEPLEKLTSTAPRS